MSAILTKIHGVRMAGLVVKKTGQVPGKFKFASLADVWETLLPALQSAGLSVGFIGSAIRMEQGLEVLAVTLECSDGTESRRETYEILLPEAIRNSSGNAVTNGSQRSGGAASYARRIALILHFNIATGDDAEVERMTPAPGQHNIPGLIIINAGTRWEDLVDGVWMDAMSPLEDGKLDVHAAQGEQHMRELWAANVRHPGMMAWGADWLTNKMQETGMAWKDVVALDAGLPAHMANCDAKQLRTACGLLAGTIKPDPPKKP